MARWLIERLAEHGGREAVILDGRTTTYAELLGLYAGWRTRLEAAGVGRGRVVAMVGDFSPSACAAFLALVADGHVIVPLTAGTHARHPEFLEIAEVELVVRPDAAPEIEARDCRASHPLTRSLAARGAAGLVLFSSGSTGESKAALHAVAPLLEKFRLRRPALRTLTFLLFDHIGGINTFLYIVANGGVLVAPSERSPAAVCRTVEEAGVELLPVSPTFLNLLLLSDERRAHDLSSLKKITYGTEPMPQSTLERTAAAFPGVALQQTYGLSELGILRSKSRGDDSLWVKVGGEDFETRVVDGVLWIKARSAMLGYLNAPSPFDDEGWFNTEDRVEVDGDYLRFLGRESEVINVGGEKVFPAEVESHILELDNVHDVVVFGEPNPLTGQIVVASVNLLHPEPAREVKKRLRRALRNQLAPFKIPQKVLAVEDAQFNERYKRMRLRRPDGNRR